MAFTIVSEEPAIEAAAISAVIPPLGQLVVDDLLEFWQRLRANQFTTVDEESQRTGDPGFPPSDPPRTMMPGRREPGRWNIDATIPCSQTALEMTGARAC